MKLILRYRNKLYLILLFLFNSLICNSQNLNVPKVLCDDLIPILTQEQLFEDFQFFKKSILDIYPYSDIFNKLFCNQFNKVIDAIEDTLSKDVSSKYFVWQIYQCLNYFPDSHLEIPHPQMLAYYKKNENLFGLSITDEIVKTNKAYYELIHDSINSNIRIGLRFKYIKGHYYNLRSFIHNGNCYLEGIKLIKVNNISVDNYVAKNRLKIPKVYFDPEQKKYFSDYLLLSPEIANEETISLTFQCPDGKELNDQFIVKQTLEILHREKAIEDTPNVSIFQDSILYVRMPLMINEEFYISEFKKISSIGANIRKVIIDIRENKGGQDKVWKKVLGLIIDKPIISQVKIYASSSDMTKEYLRRNGKGIEVSYKDTLFQKEYLPIVDQNEIIEVDSSSIHFAGVIKILVNENSFSAASSLISLSKSSENLLSLGYRSYQIGGRGLTPLIIKLPNSQMILRIPFTTDYTNVLEMKDVFQNEPEMVFEYSIEEYLKSYYSEAPFSVSFLLTEDILFNTAIN